MAFLTATNLGGRNAYWKMSSGWLDWMHDDDCKTLKNWLGVDGRAALKTIGLQTDLVKRYETGIDLKAFPDLERLLVNGQEAVQYEAELRRLQELEREQQKRRPEQERLRHQLARINEQQHHHQPHEHEEQLNLKRRIEEEDLRRMEGQDLEVEFRKYVLEHYIFKEFKILNDGCCVHFQLRLLDDEVRRMKLPQMSDLPHRH